MANLDLLKRTFSHRPQAFLCQNSLTEQVGSKLNLVGMGGRTQGRLSQMDGWFGYQMKPPRTKLHSEDERPAPRLWPWSTKNWSWTKTLNIAQEAIHRSQTHTGTQVYLVWEAICHWDSLGTLSACYFTSLAGTEVPPEHSQQIHTISPVSSNNIHISLY